MQLDSTFQTFAFGFSPLLAASIEPVDQPAETNPHTEDEGIVPKAFSWVEIIFIEWNE